MDHLFVESFGAIGRIGLGLAGFGSAQLTGRGRALTQLSFKQMLCANVEHAPYRRRTIVQSPAVGKQFDDLFGVPETGEHQELRRDVSRRLRKLHPLKPVAFCAVRC